MVVDDVRKPLRRQGILADFTERRELFVGRRSRWLAAFSRVSSLGLALEMSDEMASRSGILILFTQARNDTNAAFFFTAHDTSQNTKKRDRTLFPNRTGPRPRRPGPRPLARSLARSASATSGSLIFVSKG